MGNSFTRHRHGCTVRGCGLFYKQYLYLLVEWVAQRLWNRRSTNARQLLLDGAVDDGASWATFRWIVTQPGCLRSFPQRRREWPRAAQTSSDMLQLLRMQIRRGATPTQLKHTVDMFLPDAVGDVTVHDGVSGVLHGYFQIVNAPHLKLGRWYSSYYDPTGTDVSYNVAIGHVVHACRCMLSTGRAVWVSVCIDTEFDWDRLQAGESGRVQEWIHVPTMTREGASRSATSDRTTRCFS